MVSLAGDGGTQWWLLSSAVPPSHCPLWRPGWDWALLAPCAVLATPPQTCPRAEDRGGTEFVGRPRRVTLAKRLEALPTDP